MTGRLADKVALAAGVASVGPGWETDARPPVWSFVPLIFPSLPDRPSLSRREVNNHTGQSASPRRERLGLAKMASIMLRPAPSARPSLNGQAA